MKNVLGMYFIMCRACESYGKLNLLARVCMRERAHRLPQAILEGLQEEMSQLQARLHSKEEEVRSLQEQLEGMDNEMTSMREVIDRQDRELEKSVLEMQAARGAHRNLDAAQVIAFFPFARETERVSETDANVPNEGKSVRRACLFQSNTHA